MDSGSESGSDWYSDEWIKKQLNWGERPNKNCQKETPDEFPHNDNVISIVDNDDNVINIDDNDSIEILSSGEESELEEEIKVTFIEENMKIFRFPVLPSDNFKSVFQSIAKFKNVSVDQIDLVMMPIIRDVSHYDSLKSLNYSVCNYFYAYLKGNNHSVGDNKGTGNVEVICVAPNKEKLTYKMDEKQPFDILITYCSRDLKRDRSKFKLIFDGEVVKPSDTCISLEIVNQDLIEIHFT